jgi:hypothetical protein
LPGPVPHVHALEGLRLSCISTLADGLQSPAFLVYPPPFKREVIPGALRAPRLRLCGSHRSERNRVSDKEKFSLPSPLPLRHLL